MLKPPDRAPGHSNREAIGGAIVVSPRLSPFRKLLLYAGPGILISVGYVDPGNWATDIQAGSTYGYELLWVVVLSSLAAIVLQSQSMRLGIATGQDLASLSRERYAPVVNFVLWVLAEIAIIACDLAEVLGGALAFKLLLHVSLPVGILLTALDTLIVLGLQGSGFRRIEAIVFALVATIGVCYVVELFLITPAWNSILAGLVPTKAAITEHDGLYIAIGILGATVMPHNLYLHSSIVNTRMSATPGFDARSEALHFSRIDTIASLLVALLINAAILILAAAAFHHPGQAGIADIEDAYHLLEPIAGPAAAVIFALALLAAGQSSTFTGTMAGQVIMEGFLDLRISPWLRRIITRGLALVPALVGVMWLGEHALARLLILSQVVLSLQLPFAMFPLLRFTSDKSLMGRFVNNRMASVTGWLLFAAITGANLALVWQSFKD
jgi:manganese transport protein